MDARADLWSLGVVLYRALSGHTPHEAAPSLVELIMRICSDPPLPIQDAARWVPPEVAAILDRTLRIPPDERYPSADAMLEALRPLLPDGAELRDAMLVPLDATARTRPAPRLQPETQPPPSNLDAAMSITARSSGAASSRVPGSEPALPARRPGFGAAALAIGACLLGIAGTFAVMVSTRAPPAPAAPAPETAAAAPVTVTRPRRPRWPSLLPRRSPPPRAPCPRPLPRRQSPSLPALPAARPTTGSTPRAPSDLEPHASPDPALAPAHQPARPRPRSSAPARPAAAQPDMSRAMSRAAFEEGMRLYQSHSYLAACTKLEESLRLDAQMGTRFWLADCFEHLGRSASAWSNFLTVASEAEANHNPTRAATARARADALAPSLAKLVVSVAAAARSTPGLEIQRDGSALGPALWGTPLPVDPGQHKLRASAPGRETWEVTLDVGASGGRIEVPALREVPAPGATPPPAPPPPLAPPPLPPPLVPVQVLPPPPPTSRDAWRRPTLLVTGFVGLAGLAAGSAFGALALTTWHGAEGLCTPRCAPNAPAQQATATSYATVADAGFVLAGAGLGTALVVWLTGPAKPAPSRPLALQLAPTVGGLVLGGSFQ